MSVMSSINLITLEEVMKKNPELKMSDIRILREWCKKQPHLPKIQDVQFAVFLHSNYYKMEPTKNTIENYFTLRTHVPEFFSNRDIFKEERLRKSSNVATTIILEKKTKEGYNIIFGQILDINPSHYDFSDATKYGFMTIDQFILTHGSTCGFIYVADATGVSFGHVARLYPTSLKRFVSYIQDALPVRLLAIHLINTSPIVEAMFNMFKPFMHTDLLSLVHFHSSIESASKYFPIDALPNENGGKAGPIKDLVNTQIKKIEIFNDWFLEDEKLNRVDESLRIDKSNISNDLFGTEGSFRKIEID